MPSAELVKAWASDKNDRTAHANIALRRGHTNGGECWLSEVNATILILRPQNVRAGAKCDNELSEGNH